MNTQGQLIKKIRFEGTITALTGLHIGGTNVALSIGGADSTVVRNPLNNQPYIPGSSLKGKMRSLLERTEGKFTPSGITKFGPFVGDADDEICMIFGLTPEELKRQNKDARPVSRLIVRDCALTAESEKSLAAARTTDMPYTEVKTEVVIDRITSAATPRQIERVPAGAEFTMTLTLNVHHGDDEKALVSKVLKSLALVQDDYLGGKGTRGSGAVAITVQRISQKTAEDYAHGNDWQPHTSANRSSAAIPKELQPK